MNHRTLQRRLCALGITGITTTCTPAVAQATFGVVGGPTFSSARFYDGTGYSTALKVGVDFGCALNLPLSQHLSLYPEIAYRQKGFVQVPPALVNDEYRYLWTYDYLDLSVLLRYAAKGPMEGVHLALGPSLGWFMGGRVRDTDAKDFEPKYPLEFQNSPVGAFDPGWLGYNVLDLGVNLAAGYTFPLRGSWFGIEARYQYGLTNVHNSFVRRDVNGAEIGKINSQNRCLMLNLSWMFPVGPTGDTPTGAQ